MSDSKNNDNPPANPDDNPKPDVDTQLNSPGCFQRIVTVIKRWMTEIFSFVFVLCYSIRSITTSSFFMEKVCLTAMDFHGGENCSNMSSIEESLRDEIRKLANNYNLYATIVATAPAAVIALFVGPWGDKYGRRLPVIVGTLGEVLKAVGLVLTAYYPLSPAFYVVLTSIPAGLSGGWTSAMAAMYSQASVNSKDKSRTVKLFFIGLFVALGFPCGQLLGGQIFKYYGNVGVFAASGAFGVLSLPLGFYAMDNRTPNKIKASWKTKLTNFFSLDNVRDNLRVCMKKRENFGRAKIWLYTVSIILLSLSDMGTTTVGFYFAEKVYGWGNTEYSNYVTILNVSSMLAMAVVVLILTKCLHCSDYTLSVIGIISLFGKNVVRAIPDSPIYFFIGYAIGIPSRSASTGIRSIISKTVEKHELGKVFAFVSSLESLLPLFASALYTQLFNASISFFPGMPFMGGAALVFFPFGVSIWGLCTDVSKEKTSEVELETVMTRL